MIRNLALLTLAVVFLLGCGKQVVHTYTVVDHAGNVYTRLQMVNVGVGFASFQDSYGREYFFKSPYSYRQETFSTTESEE